MKALESGKYDVVVEIEDLNAKKSVNTKLQLYLLQRASNQ
jgi:hypothetical protein